jgi:hypothetical protein
MDTSLLLWGIIAIVCGAFFCSYGYALFRLVLFTVGFLIGFSIGMNLASGQPDGIRIIISFAAGGILGAVLYFLFSLSLYVAGAIFGFVIALLIDSLLGLQQGTVIHGVVVVAGMAIGAFFGRMLDELIIILATSLMGAYAIVYGMALIFPEQFGVPPGQVNLIPINGLSILLLIAIALISGLAQYQIFSLRRRFLR